MQNGEDRNQPYAQDSIAEALLRLLQSEPFAKLSICRLCQEAHVSRQTFYTRFGTKEKAMMYALRTTSTYMPSLVTKAGAFDHFKGFCRSYSRYIIDKSWLLEVLVKNDLMYCLNEMQRECFIECADLFSYVKNEDREYLIDFITGSLCGIAKTYVLSGCRASAKELEEIIFKLFSGDYFKNVVRDQERAYHN